MARHAPRDHPGPPRAARHRATDRRLQRLRPVGRFAARRPPGPDLRAHPAPAGRWQAVCAGGWRDRHDRRSVGAVVGAEPARRSDPRAERRRDPRTARAVPRLLAGRRPGGDGQQPGLAGRAVAHRVPARYRQALHGAVHAGQGFGGDPAEEGPVVHRVLVHAPAGARLRPPVSDVRGRDADGRRRPVGEHHRGAGAHPPDVGGGWRRGVARSRHRLSAAPVTLGRQVRQERGGRFRLAGCEADVAVRVLPVLAEHRRPRRRDVPAVVHGVLARAGRGAGRGGREPARGPRGPTGARARHHLARPRRDGGGPRGARVGGGLLPRAAGRPGGARDAPCRGRRLLVHRRAGARWARPVARRARGRSPRTGRRGA